MDRIVSCLLIAIVACGPHRGAQRDGLAADSVVVLTSAPPVSVSQPIGRESMNAWRCGAAEPLPRWPDVDSPTVGVPTEELSRMPPSGPSVKLFQLRGRPLAAAVLQGYALAIGACYVHQPFNPIVVHLRTNHDGTVSATRVVGVSADDVVGRCIVRTFDRAHVDATDQELVVGVTNLRR